VHLARTAGRCSLPKSSEPVQQSGLDPATSRTLAALLGSESVPATALGDAVRRLSVLVEVADTVTQRLSLDHQLPRLIGLIVEALDAERATLFLHDADAGELFSRVVRGEGVSEIRMPQGVGIAGSVFGSGVAEIIDDAYRDPRFNPDVDRQSGYRTRSILCVPLRNRAAQVIGVTQVLNKLSGAFSAIDMALLEAISRHAASALEQAQMMERVEQARREELELLEITEAISTELHLDTLLVRIVAAATKLLDAERSTFFVYDPGKDELWSKVAEGTEQRQIRIPANVGIAGAAFVSGDVLNISDAYADPRFNQEIDRGSGFRTRNLLNVPVIDRTGERLGVVQVLNKRGGPFTQIDIRRLKAFSAGIAVALENARLFSDVLALKNYNESILKSLSNGVVTLDCRLNVVKANEAAYRILRLSPESLVGRAAEQVFGNRNPWVTQSLDYVARIGGADYHADTDLILPDGSAAAVNLTTAPIADLEGKPVAFGARGSGLMILARYVLDGMGLDRDKDFAAVFLDKAGDGPAMVLDGRVAALWGGGVGWPGFVAVAESPAGARFIAPARFGDVVELTSQVSEFRRSSFDVEHKLFVHGAIAVEGRETRVWAVRDPADASKIKSQPIPSEVIARFQAA